MMSWTFLDTLMAVSFFVMFVGLGLGVGTTVRARVSHKESGKTAVVGLVGYGMFFAGLVMAMGTALVM